MKTTNKNFFQVAIHFMIKDGWTYDDAVKELDNALIQVTTEELISDWKVYARISRTGLTKVLTRKEKQELHLLFQNAYNHSFSAIKPEIKTVKDNFDYIGAILRQQEKNYDNS